MAEERASLQEMSFAVLRWVDDRNRLSVHSLKQVQEPKLPLHLYKPGMCGTALYPGYPREWKFRILKIGGKDTFQSTLGCANITSKTIVPYDIIQVNDKSMLDTIFKIFLMEYSFSGHVDTYGGRGGGEGACTLDFTCYIRQGPSI